MFFGSTAECRNVWSDVFDSLFKLLGKCGLMQRRVSAFNASWIGCILSVLSSSFEVLICILLEEGRASVWVKFMRLNCVRVVRIFIGIAFIKSWSESFLSALSQHAGNSLYDV